MTVNVETGEITEDEERQIRPFADWLAEQRNGSLAIELGEALNELVEAVNMTGKQGTLTLVVAVKPVKVGGGSVLVADDVRVKLPPEDRGEALYFVTKDGNLSRQNPAQPHLPLREVARTEPTEPKDLSANA